jgi:hypothetical protein
MTPQQQIALQRLTEQKYRRVIPDAQGNLIEIVENPDGSTTSVPVGGTTPGEFQKPTKPTTEPAALQKSDLALRGAISLVPTAIARKPTPGFFGLTHSYDDTDLELALDKVFGTNPTMVATVKKLLSSAQDKSRRSVVLGQIQKLLEGELSQQSQAQAGMAPAGQGNQQWSDWK